MRCTVTVAGRLAFGQVEEAVLGRVVAEQLRVQVVLEAGHRVGARVGRIGEQAVMVEPRAVVGQCRAVDLPGRAAGAGGQHFGLRGPTVAIGRIGHERQLQGRHRTCRQHAAVRRKTGAGGLQQVADQLRRIAGGELRVDEWSGEAGQQASRAELVVGLDAQAVLGQPEVAGRGELPGVVAGTAAVRAGVLRAVVGPAALVDAGFGAAGLAGVRLVQRHAVGVLRKLRAAVAGIDAAIPDDVRRAAVILQLDQERQQRGGPAFGTRQLDGAAVVAEAVAVDVHAFGVEVVAQVGFVGIDQAVVDDADAHGVVVGDLVVVDLQLVGGQHQHAGALGHAADDVPGRGEVGEVVVVGAIAVHQVLLAVLGQARQVEDQEAAGIAGGDVVDEFRPVGVLELEAGDVVLGARAANDDVRCLADVDAGVGGPESFRVLDQHVLAEHRVEPVGTVAGAGIRGVELRRAGGVVGPAGADVAEGHEAAAEHADRVARRVFHREALHDDAVGMADVEAFGGIGRGEVEDGPVLAGALDGDAALVVQDQPGRQAEAAFAELDGVAFAGVEERGEGLRGGVRAGADRVGARSRILDLRDRDPGIATGGDRAGPGGLRRGGDRRRCRQRRSVAGGKAGRHQHRHHHPRARVHGHVAELAHR